MEMNVRQLRNTKKIEYMHWVSYVKMDLGNNRIELAWVPAAAPISLAEMTFLTWKSKEGVAIAEFRIVQTVSFSFHVNLPLVETSMVLLVSYPLVTTR